MLSIYEMTDVIKCSMCADLYLKITSIQSKRIGRSEMYHIVKYDLRKPNGN